MFQRIKCMFGNHNYQPARKYLLRREVCDCCGAEIVLLPSGIWVDKKGKKCSKSTT